MITIIGNHVSPYVRKVLCALELKGVDYRVDPIIPFFGDDRFAEMSPLRRVPVFVETGEGGDFVLPDSTAICEYLDEAYPGPALLPTDPKDRARARWIEEFSDSRLGDVLVWRLFFGTLIGPRVLGRERDDAALAKVVGEDVPAALAQAEGLLPDSGYLFGDAPGTADFAIGSMLQMPGFVRQPVDPERFPRCAAFVDLISAHPVMAKLLPIAGLIMTTPPAQQRDALAAAGVSVVPAAESVGTDTPRARVMETA